MLPLEELRPIETLEIDNGLALVPRVKLNLTIHPVVSAVSKPIDEWQLKRALIGFLKTSVYPSVIVPEDEIVIRRHKDLKKRKREDPVAHGSLFIRDLGFLDSKKKKSEENEFKVLEKEFLDWKKNLVEKMNGIELNLEGVKYKLTVTLPLSDDFGRMRKEWEDHYAFGNRGYSRVGREDPDTIIVRGVPSRWFAEPRVSSKPSMLVTHTIFSTFGKIRTLNVVEDDDLGKDTFEDGSDLVSGLHCKIVVQFEKYKDFYNTMMVLSGRSMQKQGTRLKADYEVTWDKEGFFRNSRNLTQDRVGRLVENRQRNEASRYEPCSADDARRKRFKD